MFLKLILITVALSAAWFYYLTRKVNLAKYKCKYAVVTGATGGCGSELVQQLTKNVTVIAVGRSQTEIDKLCKKFEGKVIPFIFDFADDLTTFGPRFDDFLQMQKIDKMEVGLCYSNAGYGEYKSYHGTSFEHKKKFMQVNLDSHICVSDYFVKVFVERHKKGMRSGLVLTASACSQMPGVFFQMYHTAKNAISSLGNALYAEYKYQGIDVLVVHPSAVSHTKFYQHEDILVKGKKIPGVGDMENSFIAVTPQQVVDRMLTRLGKENVTQVGWAAVCMALLNCLGRNFNGLLWSVLGFNKKLMAEK